MNASNPPRWTLNSSFVAFLSVWVHLWLFCYGSKLSARWAELVLLMQKFVTRSCVGCFRNARTWSTPLDPKLIFCCVFFVFAWIGTISLLHETGCKMGWTGTINVKVHATKSCPNFSQWIQLIHPHWTLNSCFVLYRRVWEHLGPFRCFTILGSKRAELL